MPPAADAPSGANGISSYLDRIIDVDVSGVSFRLRVLQDLQQFSDPDGDAERLGISCSQWSLFGQLWPSGQRLAEAMQCIDLRGRRVLELGCGIGLPSLVLQRRGADVLATDHHPLAETFLAYNAALNGLPALRFRRFDWSLKRPDLGQFDLIIASDVLYERGQAEAVARVADHYGADDAQLCFADAGRGYASKLDLALAAQGFISSVATPGEPPMRRFARQRLAA